MQYVADQLWVRGAGEGKYFEKYPRWFEFVNPKPVSGDVKTEDEVIEMFRKGSQ